MNTNTVSPKREISDSFILSFLFSFHRSLARSSPPGSFDPHPTHVAALAGLFFRARAVRVLYSLAVNTISTDGFQTVSPHAGSQWILGLFIVGWAGGLSGTILLRSLIYLVHSFSHFVREPPSMMESLGLSRWPSSLPRFFICYLSTFDPVCECVERVMMQLGH